MLPGFTEYTADLTPSDMHLCRVVWGALNQSFKAGESITNRKINEYVTERTGHASSGPKIRKMINWIHTSGHLPGLIADSKGYRCAKSVEELDEYSGSLKGRISAIQERLQAVKRDINNYKQQQLTFK